MVPKYKTVGFGYDPADVYMHFLVDIPADLKADVKVYERVRWDSGADQTSDMDNCKVILKRKKWQAVRNAAEKELNRSLKKNGLLIGKFKQGTKTPVCRLLGKELLLLLWAVEPAATDEQVQTIIHSWLGLSREERWWLFTMVNASRGRWNDNKGWRIAVFYALADAASAPTGNVQEQLQMKF